MIYSPCHCCHNSAQQASLVGAVSQFTTVHGVCTDTVLWTICSIVNNIKQNQSSNNTNTSLDDIQYIDAEKE